MERRVFIEKLVFYTAGVALLPKILTDTAVAGEIQLETRLTLAEQELLAEIAESIIPETDTPGAKALNVHLFVMKMIADCYDSNARERFETGLGLVDGASLAMHDKTFMSSTLSERHVLLSDIQNNRATHRPDLVYFLSLMKSLTLRGYLNSQYVMTNLFKYELVPARFDGYFPVKKD